jgi:hypothetical protein
MEWPGDPIRRLRLGQTGFRMLEVTGNTMDDPITIDPDDPGQLGQF